MVRKVVFSPMRASEIKGASLKSVREENQAMHMKATPTIKPKHRKLVSLVPNKVV